MNNDRIISAVKDNYNEIVTIRCTLHANPEVGNREYKTSAFIKKYLTDLGIQAETVLETGVVGTLNLGDGHGPVIALRADMDALPVQEETGLSYASRNDGVMHACGHDIHMAAVLGAAKIISENPEGLSGTIKFIFQPDEEGNGGAKRMIEAGVMENPKVDKTFGIHVRPEIEAGRIALKYGKSYAASDMFTIEVIGKSCHGAEPENGVSAIRGGARIVEALDGLAETVVPQGEKAIISIGSFNAGTTMNVIPGRAVITGIIRTLGEDSRTAVKNVLVSTAKNAAEGCGCHAVVDIKESYPGVVNHDPDNSLILRSAIDMFGEEPILLKEPTMTTEDFGYYLMNGSGTFYHIGAGSEYPLHNSRFAPNEICLATAVMMHLKTLSELLKVRVI